MIVGADIDLSIPEAYMPKFVFSWDNPEILAAANTAASMVHNRWPAYDRSDLAHDALVYAAEKLNGKPVGEKAPFRIWLTGRLRSYLFNWCTADHRRRLQEPTNCGDNNVGFVVEAAPSPEPYTMDDLEKRESTFLIDRIAKCLLEGDTVEVICRKYRLSQSQLTALIRHHRRRNERQ